MTSKETYISLLKEQSLLIDQKNFDLNSWKKATALVIEACFGLNSPHLKTIENINYEYNSWVLRDESGVTDPVKTECKSVLNIIIKELEISDVSTDQANNDKDLSFVWLPFEDELTGAASKKLKALIMDSKTTKQDIEKFLKDLPGQTTIDILNAILTSSEFKIWLNNKG
nr:hypothetical protein [uncultured Carboxylicivirga sp.]